VRLIKVLAPNKSPEDYGLMTLNKLYAQIEAQFKELREAKPVYWVRIGLTWYQVDVFYRELSAGQYIDLMAINGKDDADLADNLDRIMAILCRKCRFLWFLPEKYNTKTFDSRRELFRNECRIKEVMGVVNFFLRSWEESSSHIATFLAERTMKEWVEGVSTLTKSES